MRHQVQGENECYLATVAALTDQTIVAVRREADLICQSFGYTTYTAMRTTSANWRRFEEVMITRYALPRWGTKGGWPLPLPAEHFPKGVDLDLAGRGVIEIRSSTWGHIVAYEDGFVFDGNCAGPLPYAQWANMFQKVWPGIKFAIAIKPYQK